MLSLLPMGMPSAGSHRLAPSSSTVSGTQGCPKGQRTAAQRECFEAVFSVTFAEELELHARQLKVVTDDAKGSVPPFCSYNRASKTAVFNTYSNKAAGTGGSYQQVCVEEEASTQGCPEGRRNAAEHECLAAVLSVAWVEGLELLDKQLKTVNNGANGAVPPGCSYSRQSMTAVFNSNKAAGNSSLYKRVCVEDEAAPVTASVRLCEAMHMGSANRNTNGYASRETDPARTGYAHNESAFVHRSSKIALRQQLGRSRTLSFCQWGVAGRRHSSTVQLIRRPVSGTLPWPKARGCPNAARGRRSAFSSGSNGPSEWS